MTRYTCNFQVVALRAVRGAFTDWSLRDEQCAALNWRDPSRANTKARRICDEAQGNPCSKNEHTNPTLHAQHLDVNCQ